jgi:transcription antitermination factor NusG
MAYDRLQSFIDKAPHVVSGYVLIGRLIFNEAKKHRKNLPKYKELIEQALIYVVEGLNVSKKDQDLLKLKYYILRETEPNNIEKIYEILLERYRAFDGNCSELKLLFELGVISFERGEYNESKAFFQELNEKSYDHPNTSGIVRVAQDIKKKERKIFRGYISKFISKKEAYVSSEEISYAIRFVPIAQKRELHPREDVEFNVAFNYRGALAIDLRPV